MSHYDYLIVGAGLFGATFAYEMTKRGKKCLVIERRNHIGGNVYTENRHGITLHKYGAHIFHTSSEKIWNYVNTLVKFDTYTHTVLANYKGRIFNLPFNMNTFYQLWGVTTPSEAMAKIESQRIPVKNPNNLEEQALCLVGKDLYETLIKEYTEKQWGRSCTELPAFIIKRLPFRLVYDNNYFNDPYQGIPQGGYTALVEKLLNEVEVKTNTAYIPNAFSADKIVYTGAIDEYFNYTLGPLEYRTLIFKDKIFNSKNVQGAAVINRTSLDEPFTRSIEHRHFDKHVNSDKSIITYEYPSEWKQGHEPYYPVNDEKNNALYNRYCMLAKNEPNIIFGGRLGQYQYFDMDKTIIAALDLVTAVC